MKMKKFFSGILAAVMSIATIAMPLSTAIAADPPTTDPNKDKCIITVNHAASTGTYTAYPIFTGNVEMETKPDEKGDEVPTSRLVIDSPAFHKNLDTYLGGSSPVEIYGRSYSGDPPSSTSDYGLWQYLKNSWKVKQVKGDTVGKTFFELIKEYDPNTSVSSFNLGNTSAYSQQAEALANILNLTSADSAVTGSNGILGSTKTSSFYSAFAEAARMLMVDKITTESIKEGDSKATSDAKALTGTAVGTLTDGKVTIEVDEPGYYLVEYTPDDYDKNLDESGNNVYEKTPRAVRRSLVLVGKGTELSATINSKDTENIATVDVTFNENILDKATCEEPKKEPAGDDDEGDESDATEWKATYDYPADKTTPDAEAHWKKNVSAGNGDYVNCRVVVTLPGNLAAYDQYYLAVPVMYGYSGTSTNNFDHKKSITRQGSDKENVKVYFLDGESKIDINNGSYTIPSSYNYADDKEIPTGGIDKDKFVANETFVFNDVKKLDESISGNTKLVIEFPVKFERFPNDMTTFGATTIGADHPGFSGNSNSSSATAYTGDDILLKNYITAKAVYSNNPNLKELAEDVDESKLSNSEKLYLDTSKDPGTLQNPVGIVKESSANIVTYRLRVHATTEDIKDKSYGGVESVYFAIKNEKGQYAKVHKIHSAAIRSYDEVDSENFYTGAGTLGTSGVGFVYLYIITEWVDVNEDSVYKNDNGSVTLNNDYVMQTNNAQTNYDIKKATNNTGRFEIIGLAPGTYTVVALEKAIKAREDITGDSTSEYKEYSISKEGGKPKTEYCFSFAPTLSDTCTKLLYNTHYAPSNFDLTSLAPSYFNENGKYDSSNTNKHSVNTTGLITNYNMKWYDMQGNEIAKEKADWWLGQREDVGLMSMRVTYIKKGLSLPVTGGIGTFIFFAVGGALVVISTVAIVTKFRMKREQL